MEKLLFVGLKRLFYTTRFAVLIIAVSSFVLNRNHAESIACCYLQDGGDLEVGDLVEFEFMGGTHEGEITRFTGNGWPYVEFEYRGRSRERFFPTSDVKLLDRSSSTTEEPKADVRTWTDKTGAFEVKARLLSHSNGKIELEKEDGRVVTLPLDKLSEPDKKFIAEIEKKAADESNSDNPFAGGTPTAGSKSNAEKSESPFESARNRSSSRSRRRRNRSNNKGPLSGGIVPEFGGNEVGIANLDWKVKPDARSTTRASKSIIGLRSTGRNSSGRIEDVFAEPSGQSLIALAGKSFNDDKTIVFADLATGRATKRTIKEKRADLFAGSHDGKTVVIKTEGRGDVPGGLQFWDTSAAESKLTHTWKTAGFFDRNGFEPKFGVMLENGQLLTFGRRIVLWDIETASDAYTFDINVDVPPAFSPGGKQYAVVSGDKIYIVETLTGKTLGILEVSRGGAGNLAFSDSGQFLAAGNLHGYETFVWDLNSGQQVAEFHGTDRRFNSLDWVGDEYILVNKEQLFDIALKASVWKFTTDFNGKLIKGGNGTFYFASANKFTPVDLLPKRLKEQTARLDPDELLVLKPGEKVSIDLSLPFSRAEISSIRKRLEAMLKSKGFVISDKAPTSLVIGVKKQKSESVEVSSVTDPFGRRGAEKITYSPSKVTISLNKNGDSIWQREYVRSPGHIIQAENNETYQQAAARLCKVKPSEFESLRIPAEIRRVPDDIKGTSKISSVGIQ